MGNKLLKKGRITTNETKDNNRLSVQKELENFKKTYNANDLARLTFRDINYIKSVSNPVQIKLIDNMSKPHNMINDYDYLMGPYLYRKYALTENGSRKIFSFFGENHRIKEHLDGTCFEGESKEFVEYLKTFIEETPVFTDIYIEIPFVKKLVLNRNIDSRVILEYAVMTLVRRLAENDPPDFNNQPRFKRFYNSMVRQSDKISQTTLQNSYTIDQLEKEFKNCIQPETRKESPECQLLRIHFVDTRITNDVHQIDFNLLTSFQLIETCIEMCVEMYDSVWFIIKLLRKINFDIANQIVFCLRTLTRRDQLNIMNVFLTDKKIKTQLDKTYRETEIVDFITNMITNDTNNLTNIGGFKKLLNAIENQTEVFDENQNEVFDISLDELKDIQDKIMFLSSYAPDLYFLSRMFKKYLPRKDEPPPFQPVESLHKIIYMGAAHIRRYFQFMDHIGAEQIHTNDYQRSNCVNTEKPYEMSPERSPVKRRSSVKRSRKRSPAKRSMRRSPVKRSMRRSPVKRSRKRSSVKRSRIRSPIKRSRKRSSVKRSRIRSPVKRSM